jgi:hypothetical protein
MAACRDFCPGLYRLPAMALRASGSISGSTSIGLCALLVCHLARAIEFQVWLNKVEKQSDLD